MRAEPSHTYPRGLSVVYRILQAFSVLVAIVGLLMAIGLAIDPGGWQGVALGLSIAGAHAALFVVVGRVRKRMMSFQLRVGPLGFQVGEGDLVGWDRVLDVLVKGTDRWAIYERLRIRYLDMSGIRRRFWIYEQLRDYGVAKSNILACVRSDLVDDRTSSETA